MKKGKEYQLSSRINPIFLHESPTTGDEVCQARLWSYWSILIYVLLVLVLLNSLMHIHVGFLDVQR